MYWTFRTGKSKPTSLGVRTPTGVDDMEAWFASNHGVEHIDNEVHRWKSKVNNHFVTQSITSRKPTLLPGVVNGQNALDFNGTSTFLTVDSAGNNRANTSLVTMMNNRAIDMTIVMVASLNTAAAGNETILSWGEIGNSLKEATVMNVAAGGLTRIQIINSATVKTIGSLAGTRDSNQHIQILRAGGSDAGTNNTWVSKTDGGNESATLNTNIVQDIPFNIFNIGKRARTGAEYWYGTVSEIMIYNRFLTDEETEAVEDYLFEKYFNPENFANMVEWFKPGEGVQT